MGPGLGPHRLGRTLRKQLVQWRLKEETVRDHIVHGGLSAHTLCSSHYYVFSKVINNPANRPGHVPLPGPHRPVPRCRKQGRGRQAAFQVYPGAETSHCTLRTREAIAQSTAQRGQCALFKCSRQRLGAPLGPRGGTGQALPCPPHSVCCWRTPGNLASALLVLLREELVESFLSHQCVGTMGAGPSGGSLCKNMRRTCSWLLEVVPSVQETLGSHERSLQPADGNLDPS